MIQLVKTIKDANDRGQHLGKTRLERPGFVPNVTLQDTRVIVDDVLVVPVLSDIASHAVDLCEALAASRELSQCNHTARQDGCDEPAIPTYSRLKRWLPNATGILQVVRTISGIFTEYFRAVQ